MPPEATLPLGEVSAVAAMGVEAWAVRRRAPHMRVHQGGIGLRGWHGSITTNGHSTSYSFDAIGREASVTDRDGYRREFGYDAGGRKTTEVWKDPFSNVIGNTTFTYDNAGRVLTATHLVIGPERGLWATKGFVAVDMESAYLAGRAAGLTVVRVILDTPQHELSSAWERPSRAALDPRNFGELVWLLRNVPRYSLRAASVLAEAVRRDVDAEV